MSWVADRQTTIYSRVNGILLSRLKDKYKSLLVTQDNATPTKTQLPTVYIAFIGASERGQTLEGNTINAVVMTAEVHVKTSSEQGAIVNNDIAWEVVDAFKTMGFEASMPPMATSNFDGVYESVSRFSRIIGQGDVI